MGGRLKLRLADGGEFEAAFEDELPPSLSDLLATGYVGNQMVIAIDDSSDVEGHVFGSSIDVRLFDEGDVEGHAMTLHLPNAQSARDLQKRLLAAGVVGVIVVGAAATAVWAPGSSTGVATDQGSNAIVAPAPPPIAPGLKADIAAGDVVVRTAPAAPAIAPGLKADIAAGDVVVGTAPAAPAISPGLKAEIANGDAAATSATVAVPAAPAISPGLKAEIANGDASAAKAPAAPAVSPGLKADLANGDTQP
jgi:hypothetical protein